MADGQNRVQNILPWTLDFNWWCFSQNFQFFFDIGSLASRNEILKKLNFSYLPPPPRKNSGLYFSLWPPRLMCHIPIDSTPWAHSKSAKICRRRLYHALERLKVRNFRKTDQWLWFNNHNFCPTFQNYCNSTRRTPGLQLAAYAKIKWGSSAFYIRIVVHNSWIFCEKNLWGALWRGRRLWDDLMESCRLVYHISLNARWP